jgi:hypothetical protein
MVLELFVSAVLSGAISSLTAKIFDTWLSNEIPERTEALKVKEPDETILVALKDEVGNLLEKDDSKIRNFIDYLSIKLTQSLGFDEEPSERASAILIILHIGISHQKEFILTQKEKNILIEYQVNVVEALSEYMNAVGKKFDEAKSNLSKTSLGIITNDVFKKVLIKLKEEVKLPGGDS